MLVKEKIVAAFLITLLGAVEAADYSSYVQLNVVDPLNNDCSWNRYANKNWSKNPFSNKMDCYVPPGMLLYFNTTAIQ